MLKRPLIAAAAFVSLVGAAVAQQVTNPIPAPIATGSVRSSHRRPGADAVHPGHVGRQTGQLSRRTRTDQFSARVARRPTVRQRFARPAVHARRERPAAAVSGHRRGQRRQRFDLSRDVLRQRAGGRVHQLQFPPGVSVERHFLHASHGARSRHDRSARFCDRRSSGPICPPGEVAHGRHRMDDAQPVGQHLERRHRFAPRDSARRHHGRSVFSPVRRPAVQSPGRSGRSRLRPDVHLRRRLGLHQRRRRASGKRHRRPARPAAAARHAGRHDAADRSAQPRRNPADRLESATIRFRLATRLSTAIRIPSTRFMRSASATATAWRGTWTMARST